MGEKHTSGPWKITPGHSVVGIETKDGKLIAATSTKTYFQSYDETDIANARLIAAAPEMLDLLNAMNDAVDTIGEQPIMAWAGAIKNAIAKATGGR